MSALSDITGQRFGRLTVVERADSAKCGNVKWKCVCDCGGIATAVGSNLRRGNTTSCGCVNKEMVSRAKKKHGLTRTPTHICWTNMRQRCGNPKYPKYADYGGRGITVCERWTTFDNFLADMGEQPDGLTIERENNDKGYGPGNCKWATYKEQANNRRSSAI